MKKFFDQYIESEYSKMILAVDTRENESGCVIRTVVYENQATEEMYVLRDMVKENCNKQYTPVVVLNFENELGLDGLEDSFLKQLLENGNRVVFIKCSYYETKNNAEGFERNGIAYWKKNMAAQKLCLEYLKNNKINEDVSFIAMNGLSSCTLAAVAAEGIACNRVFFINGVLDFQYIFEQGIWNLIFPNGYYHFPQVMKQLPIQENPELEQLNPYTLMKAVQAQEKYLFASDVLFDDDTIQIIPYESQNEIFNRILQEL